MAEILGPMNQNRLIGMLTSFLQLRKSILDTPLVRLLSVMLW